MDQVETMERGLVQTKVQRTAVVQSAGNEHINNTFKDISWKAWLRLGSLSQVEKAGLDYCSYLPTHFKGTMKVHNEVLTIGG